MEEKDIRHMGKSFSYRVTDPERVRPCLYVAAKYESRFRVRESVQPLLEAGFVFQARWLDAVDHRDRASEDRAYAQREIALDMQDIQAATHFVLDTLDEDSHGGREVEFGAFVARVGIDRVALIGPRRNLYHEEIPFRFPDWESFVQSCLLPSSLVANRGGSPRDIVEQILIDMETPAAQELARKVEVRS